MRFDAGFEICPFLSTDRDDELYGGLIVESHDRTVDVGTVHVLPQQTAFVVAGLGHDGRIHWARRLKATRRLELADTRGNSGTLATYVDGEALVITRFSRGGDVLWEKRFSPHADAGRGSGDDGLDSPVVDSRGWLTVVGRLQVPAPGLLEWSNHPRKTSSALFAIFDEHGNVVAARGEPTDFGATLARAADGRLYQARDIPDAGIAIEAMDSEGTPQWVHLWTGIVGAPLLATAPDGALVAVGEFAHEGWNDDGMLEGQPLQSSPGSLTSELYVVRLEPDGRLDFERKFRSGLPDFMFRAFAVDRDGNTWIAGVVTKRIELGSFVLTGKEDDPFPAFLAVLDPHGQVRWAGLPLPSPGGILSLVPRGDGGVLVSAAYEALPKANAKRDAGKGDETEVCALINYPGVPAAGQDAFIDAGQSLPVAVSRASATPRAEGASPGPHTPRVP